MRIHLSPPLYSPAGPLVRLLDVETSHKVGIMAAKFGLFPKETRPDPACLKTTVWGREFPNPLGELYSRFGFAAARYGWL